MTDVTQILSQLEQGEPGATDRLLPLVYEELRRLAKSRMAGEREDHTLQATALVHEAYLRLVKNQARAWDSRGHFFAAAAEAMRRTLVESARRKARARHGGGCGRRPIGGIEIPLTLPCEQLLALHEALEKLEAIDPQSAQLVKLRFFSGFSMPEVAEAVGRPLRTVEREWTYARSWLHRELSSDLVCDG